MTDDEQLTWSVQAWDFLAGLAADFWKDGGKEPSQPASLAPNTLRQAPAPPIIRPKNWCQDSVHIAQAIWGPGHCLPGGDAMIDRLALPLGTNKEISCVDFSAGLGAVGRRLATTLETYVTGYETDPVLAEEGMALLNKEGLNKHATIEAFDPDTYEVSKRYDCIFARELFYRVKDKPKFFKSLRDSIKENPKPYAQMVFTDYVLELSERHHPAIKAWLAHEPNARPIGLKETEMLLKKQYFDIRVKEDLTELYIHEIKSALTNFALFLKENPVAPEAKAMVAHEIATWAYREVALENGLKFYRFYVIR